MISLFNTVQSVFMEDTLFEDYDPLVDVNVTVDFLCIRALEDFDNSLSNADFFIKLTINDVEFESQIWNDKSYVYNPQFSATVDVPDDEEYVNIKIELWEWSTNENILCDIGDETDDVYIIYSIKTGSWFGGDELKDKSGYGRLNGFDDGSIYNEQQDCELWFNIYQNDYDKDTLTYWNEVNIFETDPMVNNLGEDYDEDLLTIEYESKWGLNPLIYEDHMINDFDNDSLSNYEEFLTRDFLTDPYRQDVLIEYDFMETGPSGEENIVPFEADELLKNPFHRRNINIHIDRNEMIPFEENVAIEDVFNIYDEYFLHNDSNSWRRSVFHYGLFVNECSPPGYGFSGDVIPYWGYIPGTNGFVISCRQMERSAVRDSNTLAYTFGSAIMHEMGHNFGIRRGNPSGCDNRGCIYPWRLPFWLYRNYQSLMNYRYTYKIFDYSDGSHGKRDFDDWNVIDLSYFEIPK